MEVKSVVIDNKEIKKNIFIIAAYVRAMRTIIKKDEVREEVERTFLRAAYRQSMKEFRIWGLLRGFNIENDVKNFLDSGKIPEYMIMATV